MQRFSIRALTAGLVVAMLFVANPAFAQSTEEKAGDKERPGDKDTPQAGETKHVQEKTDDFAEAERFLTGPAANPECLWLGRRVVSLLWRDDLDTAFRHLELYDGSIARPAISRRRSAALCARETSIRRRSTLNTRVHGCWLSPNAETQGTPLSPSTTPWLQKRITGKLGQGNIQQCFST
jgi:hypothetical protein